MSQNTIDVLNDEELLEIFAFLDGRSLKNCCQVSKRFNEIIGNNKSTMRKLPLFVSSEMVNLKPKEIELTRHYHTLIFEKCTIQRVLVNRLINQNILEHVMCVELINASINVPKTFASLLKNMPKLEKILIVSSNVSGSETVDLPSLKSLTFVESKFEFLNFIGTNSLHTFKIHHKSFSSSDEEILETFLQCTDALQHLAVRVNSGSIYSTLVNEDDREYNFGLKSLSVTFNSFERDETASEKFLELLKQHEQYLEHLEINCKLTDDTYEYIFGSMKINSLRLDGSHLPSRHLFFNSIAPNNHLKKLIVTKKFENQAASEGLFRIFKSIEDLNIFEWKTELSNEILIAIANNLTRIRNLSIPNVPDNPTEIPMPSLHTLHVESISRAASFRQYVSQHVNVRKLSAKWIQAEVDYDTLNVITNRLKNLEVLSFGPTFNPTRRLYSTIHRNAPNLKKIDVFRFADEPVDKRIEDYEEDKQLKIKTFYFTNRSSSLIFKFEQGIWDELDMLFPFSAEDMAHDQNRDLEYLNDDYNRSDTDSDDDDMRELQEFDEDDYQPNNAGWIIHQMFQPNPNFYHREDFL